MIVKTGITADKPTPKGSVYPLEVLERMVKECNTNLERDKPVTGGWLSELHMGALPKDRKPQPQFFELKALKLNDDKELLAEIKFTDEKQKLLIEGQKDSELVAKLVIELPLDQSVGETIKEVRRVRGVALTWNEGKPGLIQD